MHTYIRTNIYIYIVARALPMCAKQLYTKPYLSVQRRNIHSAAYLCNGALYIYCMSPTYLCKAAVNIALPICATELRRYLRF